jgi:hypothetical protein
MKRVFIYETLKKRKILEEALGEKHGKPLTPAMCYGFEEHFIHHAKSRTTWPTLWPMGKRHSVRGYIINVTDIELMKLKKWERHYRAQLVQTNHGDALAFIFDPHKR